jgi:outer membrane biogenesis lipoprotein LolB
MHAQSHLSSKLLLLTSAVLMLFACTTLQSKADAGDAAAVDKATNSMIASTSAPAPMIRRASIRVS